MQSYDKIEIFWNFQNFAYNRQSFKTRIFIHFKTYLSKFLLFKSRYVGIINFWKLKKFWKKSDFFPVRRNHRIPSLFMIFCFSPCRMDHHDQSKYWQFQKFCNFCKISIYYIYQKKFHRNSSNGSKTTESLRLHTKIIDFGAVPDGSL